MIPATCHQTAPVHTESLVPSLGCPTAKALGYDMAPCRSAAGHGHAWHNVNYIEPATEKTESHGLQGREVPKIGREVTECVLFERGHVQLIGGE